MGTFCVQITKLFSHPPFQEIIVLIKCILKYLDPIYVSVSGIVRKVLSCLLI